MTTASHSSSNTTSAEASTAERAEAFAAEHDVPHAHGSWQALADDPAVDVVYVGMFVVKGLLLTSGLYAVMIGLAVMGYREWRQTRRVAAR